MPTTWRSGQDTPTVGDVLHGLCFSTCPDLSGQTSILWTLADRALAVAALNNSTEFDVWADTMLLYDYPKQGSRTVAYREIRRQEVEQLVEGSVPVLLRPGHPRQNLEKLRKIFNAISAEKPSENETSGENSEVAGLTGE